MADTEFVVGQWVTRSDGSICQVASVGESGGYVRNENAKPNESPWLWLGKQCMSPLVWQAGKTYRTPIDGVTVTISRNDRDVVEGLVFGGEWNGAGAAWDKATGIALPNSKRTGLYGNFPDLLPYLADEQPPSRSEQVRHEAAEERAALEVLSAEFVDERRLCEREIEKWELRLAAWKVAVRKVEQAIERAK